MVFVFLSALFILLIGDETGCLVFILVTVLMIVSEAFYVDIFEVIWIVIGISLLIYIVYLFKNANNNITNEATINDTSTTLKPIERSTNISEPKLILQMNLKKQLSKMNFPQDIKYDILQTKEEIDIIFFNKNYFYFFINKQEKCTPYDLSKLAIQKNIDIKGEFIKILILNLKNEIKDTFYIVVNEKSLNTLHRIISENPTTEFIPNYIKILSYTETRYGISKPRSRN